MKSLARYKVGGFTLVELIMVIVILGILSAIAIPRLFDFSGDARKASTLGILGAVRTAVSLYYTKNALPPPTGGNRPWWPNITQMQQSDGGPGEVMETKMADNPYSINATVDGRNDVSQITMTSSAVRPAATAGNVGAWAYDQSGGAAGMSAGEPYAQPSSGSDVGTFWANTSTSGVTERDF